MKYIVKEVITTINDPKHKGQTVYKIYDTLKDRMSFASYKTIERAKEICKGKNNEYVSCKN